MKIDFRLPPKSPLRSKAFWAAALGIILSVYDAAAGDYGWRHVPTWVWTLVGSFGIYGLRAARRPLDWSAGRGSTEADPTPASTYGDLPDAAAPRGLLQPAQRRQLDDSPFYGDQAAARSGITELAPPPPELREFQT